MEIVNKIEQLQTSKINLENIHLLNSFVHFTSKTFANVNREYLTETFLHTTEDLNISKWKYRINKYGFRGKDWSFKKETFGFFGCSFTFGIGVERSVADIVEGKTGIESVNLGIPGASIKNIIKTFAAFSNLHPMKYALITLPEYSRIYYPHYDQKQGFWKHHNLLANMIDDRHIEEIKRNTYKYYLTEDTLISEMADAIDWADSIAKEKDIQLLWCFWDPSTNLRGKHLVDSEKIVNFPDIIDHARDNGHPGQRTVENWSNNIIGKIKNV